MTKITQKQLIESLKQFKEIKPRKEWAVLLKSQILTEKETVIVSVPAKRINFMDAIASVFSQRKLAYSFAVVLFLIVGVFGFAQHTVPGDLLFPVRKVAEQSQAALTGQSGLKQSVANLNNRINDLVQVAKEGKKANIPSAIDEIKTDASYLTKSLKSSKTENSQTIKDIVSSLKTLADVPGTDLTATPAIKGLYQAVVQSQIVDLQETTLADEQKETLSQAIELYNQGKYTEALEKILLIGK